MPLNPQARALMDTLAAAGAKPIHQLTPAQAREAMAQLSSLQPPSTARIAGALDRTIPGPSGPLRIRIYTPVGGAPFPVVVFFHGGGFVIGSLDSHDSVCREACAGAGVVVVSVDYRLAPEAPFPAATDDCLAATRWVGENAAAIGGDPARIAVAGDSAGGNLAAVTSLRVRDEGGPRLRAQWLIYPATNAAGPPAPSVLENAKGYLLEKVDMDWFVAQYVPSADDQRHPHCSVLLAPDLSGLPPALVQTMELDPLRDEGEDYAHRLRSAGVPVVLSRYDGGIHGTIAFVTIMAQGRAMMDEGTRWLREQLGASP